MNKRLISMVFAAAIAAVSFSVSAQSEDALKHAATMEAIGKLGDAMKAQADALKVAVERGGGAPQPIIMQQAAQPARDCTGWSFFPCAIRETWGGVKDVLHEIQPFAPAAAQIILGKQNASVAKYTATEARLTNADNQQTHQAGYSALLNLGLKPAPSTPAGPTFNLNNSNGNNFGGGQLTYAPITDAYKVGRYCYPTTTTTGGVTTTGQTCVGG